MHSGKKKGGARFCPEGNFETGATPCALGMASTPPKVPLRTMNKNAMVAPPLVVSQAQPPSKLATGATGATGASGRRKKSVESVAAPPPPPDAAGESNGNLSLTSAASNFVTSTNSNTKGSLGDLGGGQTQPSTQPSAQPSGPNRFATSVGKTNRRRRASRPPVDGSAQEEPLEEPLVAVGLIPPRINTVS
jgi:hypothetical protein